MHCLGHWQFHLYLGDLVQQNSLFELEWVS